MACPSGRRCITRNDVWGQTHRGFKSHRHRQPIGPVLHGPAQSSCRHDDVLVAPENAPHARSCRRRNNVAARGQERPATLGTGGRGRRTRRGDRDVSQRLARVGGPRRHRLPARPGTRARRGGGRGRSGRHPMGGRRPGDGPLRVRMRALRVVPGRQCTGLPRPAAARFHPLGLVRGVRRAARGRHQPGRRARAGGLRHRCQPGLPLRDGLPRARRARPGRRGRMGHRHRRRRGRPERGDDRPCPRSPGHRGGPQPGGARGGDRPRSGPHPARRRHRHPLGRRRPRTRRQSRRGRRRRQRADVRRRHSEPSPPRSACSGRAAPTGRGTSAGADGARHRVGARPPRQPRHGRDRLSRR